MLYDANACFGMDMVNHECVNHENFIVMEKVDIARDVKELIAYMDRAGIDKANVWYRSMYDYDPYTGNRRIVEAIRGYEDRLSASFTLLPAITDKDFENDKLFPLMKENNVRTLHAFPLQNRYMLSAVTMGEQLEEISDRKIPLYLSPMNGWEMIYNVLKEFPLLTVVLYNIGWWPSARYVYPLLKAYKNVYFETGDFSMIKGYEDVTNRFGSERMLFGTNFPTNAMAGSICCLEYARISDKDKENIAYGNITRLLSGVIL
ncbi:MAG: amidohydrolase family protein [Clostridia bacterium]|nr:amidohydrolase family protein [Clostridia bacterium]